MEIPWWKNSSVTFSLHCLLSSQGLHGLQMSAHFRAICTHTHTHFHELSPLLYTLFLYIIVFCASLSGLAHLQDEVAVRGISQTQLLLVQVCPEPGQVFVLPADICGQNQRPQLPLHVHTEQRDHRVSCLLYCL